MTILIRSPTDESCSSSSNGSDLNADSSSITTNTMENAFEIDSHDEKLHQKISQIRMFHSNVLLIGLGVVMMTVHLGLTVAWLFCGYIIRNTVSNIILIFGLDLFVILIGSLGISASKSRKTERNYENLLGALHWMACMFGLSFASFVLFSQSCVEFSQNQFYQILFDNVMDFYNNYQNVDIPFVKPPFQGSEMEIQTQEKLLIYTNPVINLIFFFLLASISILATIVSYRRFIKRNHNYLFPKSQV